MKRSSKKSQKKAVGSAKGCDMMSLLIKKQFSTEIFAPSVYGGREIK
ncbi:hypothetical protein AM202_02550 [Actinobacillus minor 202]|uniref:Uncharacterized protein n=1 Tax=Actinobacillus minor 202 TaxID=591023 RepID=A0ABM9YUP1_9PAST|nr:hypothetical protein AM202_02550 [Actinobacillus minor 202]